MKIKNLILSLCIALTIMLGAVVGIVGITSNKSVSEEGVKSTVAENIKPKHFRFAPNAIEIKTGGSSIDYSYTPSSASVYNEVLTQNEKGEYITDISATAEGDAVAVAYEYCFNNTMDRAAAVSLKSIDTTGVYVSYKYSTTPITANEIHTSNTKFELQRLNSQGLQGDRVYIYVLVTPINASIPASFTANVIWYYGIPKEIPIKNNINEDKQSFTVVNNQEVTRDVLPTADEIEIPSGYYLDAYFYDKDFTQLAIIDENVNVTNDLYVRYHNTPQEAINNFVYNAETKEFSSGIEFRSYVSFTETDDFILPTWCKTSAGEGVLVEIYNGEDFYGISCNKLIFSNSIERLRNGNFYSCSVSVMQMPAALKELSSDNFANCSVASIDFSLCKNLITIEQSAFSGVYDGCEELDFSACTSLTTIETNAFSGINDLRNIKLPDSIYHIEPGAFDGCDNLEYNIYSSVGKYLGNDHNPYLVLVKRDAWVTDHFEIAESCRIMYGGNLTYEFSYDIPASVVSIEMGVFPTGNFIEMSFEDTTSTWLFEGWGSYGHNMTSESNSEHLGNGVYRVYDVNYFAYHIQDNAYARLYKQL